MNEVLGNLKRYTFLFIDGLHFRIVENTVLDKLDQRPISGIGQARFSVDAWISPGCLEHRHISNSKYTRHINQIYCLETDHTAIVHRHCQICIFWYLNIGNIAK